MVSSNDEGGQLHNVKGELHRLNDEFEALQVQRALRVCCFLFSFLNVFGVFLQLDSNEREAKLQKMQKQLVAKEVLLHGLKYFF